MAKTTQPTMQGDGFPPPLPKEVQDAADAYQAENLKLSKQRGKLNAAKDRCIEAMQQNGVEVVTFSDGTKDLCLENEPRLRYRKRKKPIDDQTAE